MPCFHREVGIGVKACGFTGYRPEKMPFRTDERHADCVLLKKELEQQVRIAAEEGFTHFICGGARGADTYAAEAVLKVQKEIPSLILEIAVPFWGQEKNWSPADQRRYHDILERAQRVTYVSDQEKRENYMLRNRYIVDRSDRLIAVFDGKPGGTAMTVRYAEKAGVEVIQVLTNGTQIQSYSQMRLFAPVIYDCHPVDDGDEDR